MKIPSVLTEHRLLTLMYLALRFAIRVVITGPARLAGLLLSIPLLCLLISGTAESTLEAWLQREAVVWRTAPEGYIMQERCQTHTGNTSVTVSPYAPGICEQVPVSLSDHTRENLKQIIGVWGFLSLLTLLNEFARLICLCRQAFTKPEATGLRSSLYRYNDE